MREPSPAELPPPWRTPERAALQADARDFASPAPRSGTPGSTCRSAPLTPGSSFALADMYAELAQARAFWQQVAHLLDEGEPAEQEAAAVKLLATETAVRVTDTAMQLHGGNGYTTERRVERCWRDARLTTIFEGTSEIQRGIISDRMLPRA